VAIGEDWSPTDGIEVALTTSRRGLAYSAEELEAIQTAVPKQCKRIMRRRSMTGTVAEATSALKEAFRTMGLVADGELPA
jgi:phage-related tail protein